jgi:hypothetical protein
MLRDLIEFLCGSIDIPGLEVLCDGPLVWEVGKGGSFLSLEADGKYRMDESTSVVVFDVLTLKQPECALFFNLQMMS